MKKTIALLSALLWLSSVALVHAQALPSVKPEQVGLSSERLGRIMTMLRADSDKGQIPGAILLVSRQGKIAFFETVGVIDPATKAPMTKDAIFRIYSMTKPIASVAALILVEEGKVSLSDPVAKYIPQIAEMKVGVEKPGADGTPTLELVPPKRQMTVQDLLRHTSGLTYGIFGTTLVKKDGTMELEDMVRPPTMREIMSHTAGFGYGLAEEHPVDKLYRQKEVLSASNLQEMIDRTATIPLMFQPGANWSYSSSVDIQGYIIEKLSGQTLGQFMQQRIYAPLKMSDTAFFTGPEKASRLAAVYSFDRDQNKIVEAKTLFGVDMPDYTKPPRNESGGGGLVSTTMDYARFSQMLANGGELDGVRILAPATVELMGTNVIPKSVLVNSNGTSVARFNEAVGFGLDFQVATDARDAGSLQGDGSMSWGGAAGTWFWVDPTNDIIFVGMIQRMGGTGGDDLGTMARTLTYQALVHPEK